MGVLQELSYDGCSSRLAFDIGIWGSLLNHLCNSLFTSTCMWTLLYWVFCECNFYKMFFNYLSISPARILFLNNQ